MPKPDYDTTLARIAGNIAGHMLDRVLVVHMPDGARYPADSIALVVEEVRAVSAPSDHA